MNINFPEWISIGDHEVCSAQHLVNLSGLSTKEFDELVEIGVIPPVDGTVPEKSFHLRYVLIANTARRLRDDFELDLHGMALAMKLVQRIDELQEELNAARAQLANTVSEPDENG